VLAEIDASEAENLEVARGQDYVLALSVYDESNKRNHRFIAPNIISISNEAQARVELQLSEDPQPVLTAKLLQDIQQSPVRLTARPSLELASGGDTTNPTGSRTVASGEQMKLKGVVTRRDADTFVVRDMNGVDTMVRLGDRTSVKTKGGFLRRGADYAQTSILRGLNLEVEGRGNSSGELDAEKIRFNEADIRLAYAVESRAAPLEERADDTENKLAQVEANAQRLSGQLEELAAVSNAARGGSKAAQAAADAAVAGVNATNERISALDDYQPQTTAAVNFRSGSAELSPEAKTTLDDIASKALNAKGYVLEIQGFADSRGSINLNRLLSQRRADAVIRYLVENHNIPLRRIVTPFGYGELNPVAENTSREGRAQNRRVEIKLLVNKGLTTPAPTMNSNPG
jgi:outer membrane protein OmpA-like peptidoglycan-associated protein